MQPRRARHAADSDEAAGPANLVGVGQVPATVLTPGAAPDRAGGGDDEAEESLPSFSVQMAEQLGGVRGLVESSIPVTLFVIVNFLGQHLKWWPLRTSLIIAVAVALVIAGYRLSRRESVRHSLNGVFGVAIGAFIAYRSNDARDFYLPGILINAATTLAIVASALFRRPLVGWVWSVMADGGGPRWREDPRLLRVFGRLTVLWAVVYGGRVAVQIMLWAAHQTDLLGVMRLVLGWPPYILLAAFTVWRVRRITHPPEPVTS